MTDKQPPEIVALKASHKAEVVAAELLIRQREDAVAALNKVQRSRTATEAAAYAAGYAQGVRDGKRLAPPAPTGKAAPRAAALPSSGTPDEDAAAINREAADPVRDEQGFLPDVMVDADVLLKLGQATDDPDCAAAGHPDRSLSRRRYVTDDTNPDPQFTCNRCGMRGVMDPLRITDAMRTEYAVWRAANPAEDSTATGPAQVPA